MAMDFEEILKVLVALRDRRGVTFDKLAKQPQLMELIGAGGGGRR